MQLDGHSVIAAEIALDRGAGGVPAHVVRGDQCGRHVARGNLNEHRRLRGGVDVHARASRDCRAQLLDVDQQGVVTRHGVIGAQLRLLGLQALPVGLDALPAL